MGSALLMLAFTWCCIWGCGTELLCNLVYYCLKTGRSMSKMRGDVQPCISLEKAGENRVCVHLLVRIAICLLTCLINVSATLCLGVFCPSWLLFRRLLCSYAQALLHSNEKWQRREYHSRLRPGLAGSVRPTAPQWQSPYFWEDGSVIGLIYFTPLPCNWTPGRRFNQSCQSHHWEGIWVESKVEKWKSFFGGGGAW